MYTLLLIVFSNYSILKHYFRYKRDVIDSINPLDLDLIAETTTDTIHNWVVVLSVVTYIAIFLTTFIYIVIKFLP